ncbi:MAG: hypothetical protein Q4C70_09935 [Planctomycetia bacterium]|nr:hypothetical protein [Planctomycetia bacterium]
MKFYYQKNRINYGPYEAADLQNLTTQGIITPDTLILTDNGKQSLAKHVNGLAFPVMPTAQINQVLSSPAFSFSSIETPKSEDYNNRPKSTTKTKSIRTSLSMQLHKVGMFLMYIFFLALVLELIVSGIVGNDIVSTFLPRNSFTNEEINIYIFRTCFYLMIQLYFAKFVVLAMSILFLSAARIQWE